MANNWWEQIPDLQALGVDKYAYMFPTEYGGINFLDTQAGRQLFPGVDLSSRGPAAPGWTGGQRISDADFDAFLRAYGKSRGGLMRAPQMNWEEGASSALNPGVIEVGGGAGWAYTPAQGGGMDVRYIPDVNEHKRIQQELSDQTGWEWLSVPLAAFGGMALANAGFATGPGAFEIAAGVPGLGGAGAAGGALATGAAGAVTQAAPEVQQAVTQVAQEYGISIEEAAQLMGVDPAAVSASASPFGGTVFSTDMAGGGFLESLGLGDLGSLLPSALGGSGDSSLGSLAKLALALGGTGLAGSALGGMLGSGGSAGGVTNDFIGAARETAQGNMEAMLASSMLNHPNQSNPYGSTTWEYDPVTGQWTANTQFSEGQQALYDQSLQTGLMSGDLATMALWNNADRIANPIDFSALPASPVAPGQTAYDAMMARFNPQMTADRDTLATKLANQGIDIGSRAYAEALRLQGQNENDLRLQAAREAIPLDFQARTNALQEQTLASQLPISNVNALRTGTQPTMPNFGNTWTPATNPGGADILSATQMQNASQVANQNLQTATQNQNMQGLFNLGTSVLGSKGFWDWLGG